MTAELRFAPVLAGLASAPLCRGAPTMETVLPWRYVPSRGTEPRTVRSRITLIR